MADPSEHTASLENLRISSEPSCCMSASSDSTYVTALAFETECAIPSSSTTFFSACSERTSNGDDKSVEDAIERSKVHWSELIERSDLDDKEEAEVSNVKVFQSLQKHPTWGKFFCTFGDGGIYDNGKLELDKKPFAEGAQAELYNAHVTWKVPEVNSIERELGVKYALKVFRKGTFLRDLQKQWPQGMFKQYEDDVKCRRSGSQILKYTIHMQCGILLPDGRFAFLLVRESEDLRTLIDYCMEARVCTDVGPFSKEMENRIMAVVARGMLHLHNLNIVHRDLKASNVLCARWIKKMDKNVYCFNVANREVPSIDSYEFYVADYECSIGVIGTGFFRTPEILQAVKDKVVYENPNLFTKETNVYSYGMLCYEILTGKLPFHGHRTNDYDLVLKGSRPEVPDYVEGWARDLLYRCWQSDPAARPTFREILSLIRDTYPKHQIA